MVYHRQRYVEAHNSAQEEECQKNCNVYCGFVAYCSGMENFVMFIFQLNVSANIFYDLRFALAMNFFLLF